YKDQASPNRHAIDDALAGNLCRCTGYRPIVSAAEEMYRLGAAEADDGWLRAPHASGRGAAEERQRVERLQAIARKGNLAIEADGKRFFAPATLDELARLVGEFPDATLLAGGTDVALRVTKELRDLPVVIFTGRVQELQGITVSATHIEIGAAVTLTDAMLPILEHYPEFEELLLRFASPPIRNAGTLGGNVANGSPIGDSMPALLALDAVLVLRQGAKLRELPLRDFYLDYRQTALEPGELLERVRIPLPVQKAVFRTYKVSKRFDQDNSAVCGAYWLEVDCDRVTGARIAYGGMAAVPKRAMEAEAALIGGEWNEASVRQAMAALARDFRPLGDMRSSADYRRQVCANLLYRFYLETRGARGDTVYGYGRQKLA
ncbi:MAG: xanthine dehydrogenase small subunit, partial [Geminicoccales bacterium]